MTLGQQTTTKNFPYGGLVTIPDTSNGDETCYCVDQNILETIASLPAKNMNRWWATPGGDAARGCLTVWKTDYGYLVYRRFPDREAKMLSHQLSGRPILFPTLQTAQTTAGLCFPKPNPHLGFFWWIYPFFVTL